MCTNLDSYDIMNILKLTKRGSSMPYNQIAANGTIVFGANPPTLSAVAIKKQIETDLRRNDYIFKWNSRRSQPYSGVLDDGDNQIDVYIYAWNMTPAYRSNPS